MNKLISLWEGTAPYTGFSPDQDQPTLKSFCVPGSKGAVIVLPGGGYQKKAAHEGDPIAMKINEAGVSAFVLDYRVYPCHKMAPLSDANRAVRVVRSLGYEKVGILGFSAGGNLCVNAATHFDFGNPESDDPIERYSSRPDAFIPCYAVVSMVSYTHRGTVVSLLDKDADSIKDRRFFSGELNITPETPPAFLWHTAEDGAVPVENSLMLSFALSKNSVPFELHVFPDGHHGLGLAQSVPHAAQWADLMNRWLIKMGFSAE